MKWPKLILAVLLLLMAFPLWRLLDWANVLVPFPIIFRLFLLGWFITFILLPLRVMVKRFNWRIELGILALFSLLVFSIEPFSSKAVLEPTQSHCGAITYTGFFYQARSILSPSYQDDLELRNQICWMTKLIKKTPHSIPADELEIQLNLLKNKLAKPPFKYRVSLPWITFLIGSYINSTPPSESRIQQLQNANLFTQNIRLLTQLYADEISARNYSWYEWPHSALIKMEYGFIERNWEEIHIQLSK